MQTSSEKILVSYHKLSRSNTNSSTFSSIPHEETVEVAINKDTKIRGSLVGKISDTMSQTNGYELLVTKLFTSTAAKLCVVYDPQVPPATRMAGQPACRETVQGVIGTLSQLVNPFVHHEMITHLASRKYATPEMRLELTFSIFCEVWQRISVCHRVQHIWLMPFVSIVSLGQSYPPFSIKVTVHGTSVPQGATHMIDAICLLHSISRSALPSFLHQGYCAWYERRTHRECVGVYHENW